jgi:hypothetical protein
MYPNLDFWLENIPSGNPGIRAATLVCVHCKQDIFSLDRIIESGFPKQCQWTLEKEGERRKVERHKAGRDESSVTRCF